MQNEISREDVIEFLKESRDYLYEVEPTLIELQQEDVEGEESREKVSLAFRIFHSIKGVAGFLSFNEIQSLTHKVEELLDIVRGGKAQLTPEILQATLSATDLMKELLEIVEQTNSDKGKEEDVVALKEQIEALLETHGDEHFHYGGEAVSLSENATLFPCFTSPSFLSHFADNYCEAIGLIEMRVLDILDSPNSLEEIIEEVVSSFQRISLNQSMINMMQGIPLMDSIVKAFKKMHKTGNTPDPDSLGELFGCFEWLKEFGLSETLAEDVLAQRNQLMENLKNIVEDEAKQPEENPEEKLDQINEDATTTEPEKKPQLKVVKNESRGDIRIELEKIDKLIELIEELGVISGVLSRDSDLDKLDEQTFIHAAGKLKQITGSLQDVAMSVRLMPVGATFKKMSRLAYDVSNKLGKKVKLTTQGEETEIDKNMLEAIQDPLVHIFRNAIDHGLEMPEERIQSGKLDVGNIELSAWLGGGEFFLSIRDDGKGMDPEVIFQKAQEKGVVDGSANLSAKEKLALILEPGFSTAQEVTDFSGRGVGMDVVKQAIEKLNGNIEIESEIGKGTTFLISFPLTSTIVETVLVRVKDLIYSVRVAAVNEFFKARLSDLVVTPNGQENIKLRDEIFPMIRLSKLNGISELENIEDMIFLLVENKGTKVVLMVDEIVGTNQNVVKSLPKYFHKVTGVSGCSVIGTSSNDVSWTLDINSLLGEIA